MSDTLHFQSLLYIRVQMSHLNTNAIACIRITSFDYTLNTFQCRHALSQTYIYCGRECQRFDEAAIVPSDIASERSCFEQKTISVAYI